MGAWSLHPASWNFTVFDSTRPCSFHGQVRSCKDLQLSASVVQRLAANLWELLKRAELLLEFSHTQGSTDHVVSELAWWSLVFSRFIHHRIRSGFNWASTELPGLESPYIQPVTRSRYSSLALPFDSVETKPSHGYAWSFQLGQFESLTEHPACQVPSSNCQVLHQSDKIQLEGGSFCLQS